MATQSNNTKPNPITPWLILGAVRLWFFRAIAVGLVLASIGGTIAYSTWKPEYKSAAVLRIVDQQGAPSLYAERAFAANQVEMLKSRRVADTAYNTMTESSLPPEIADKKDKQSALARMVNVTRLSRNADYYEVSIISEDKGAAYNALVGVVDSYVKVQDKVSEARSAELIQALGESVDAALKLLKAKQAEYERLAQEIAPESIQLSDVESESLRILGQLMEEEASLEREESSLADQIFQIENRPADAPAVPVTDEAVEQVLATHPEVRRLEVMIQNLELAKRNMELQRPTDLGERHPEMLDFAQSLSILDANIDHRQKLLQARRLELLPQLRRQMEQGRQEVDGQELAAMKDRLTLLRKRRGKVGDQVKRQKIAVDQGRKGFLALKVLEFEKGRAELDYEYALGSLREVERYDAVAPAAVTIYEKPVLPRDPVESSPLKLVLLAVGAGLALPFGVAIGWEILLRRVSTRRVGGADPPEGGRRSVSSSRPGTESSRRTDAFPREHRDGLRTSLMLAHGARRVQVLAVNSAVSREGKTSVASQLALSLACSAGKRTLLIDADLRAPDIHSVFDIDMRPGLAEILQSEGKVGFLDAVHTYREALDILPAGTLRTNPHKLIGSSAFRELLDQARDRYDYVVIDTPPVLAASEGVVIAAMADANLLCVMRNQSRRDQVALAQRRLQDANAPLAGVVLSGVPHREYAYHYGDYDYAVAALDEDAV